MPADDREGRDLAGGGSEEMAGATTGLPSLALFALAGGTVILDQGTKAAVRAWLPLHDSVSIIPGFLNLTHVRNTGAAFGLLNAVDFPFKSMVMTLVALIALVAIGVYASKMVTNQPLARVGLALVMGGAVGNLIDRVSAGYVVDFVDVYLRGWHFWVFNVADAGITIGASLLILDTVWVNRHVSETA